MMVPRAVPLSLCRNMTYQETPLLDAESLNVNDSTCTTCLQQSMS